MPSAVSTRLTGRALNYGFLADAPSPETPGAVFEPMRDGRVITSGWRKGPNNGGVPLLPTLALLALPLGLMGWRRWQQAA
jgi:hypothetical protein